MFELNERLQNDTFEVCELPLCKVLLMNNAFFPWLILVPKRADMKEIIDLNKDDRLILWEEVDKISYYLKDNFETDKLNIAAIGNQVEQLHIHIIARYKNDIAWPEPVWGGKSTPYDDELKKLMMDNLSQIQG